MLESILTNPIFAFIVLIGLVVFFHEFGHFIVGRLLGVEVEEFSIGFGPKAFGFKYKSTEYKICWLPLGGYVRFYGADVGGEISLAKREKSIVTAKLYKRFLISAAGPAANFVLSFLIMVVLSAVGIPHPSARVAVLPGKVAQLGGMRSGDKVLEIATPTESVTVASWKDLTETVSKNPGVALQFKIERPGNKEPVLLSLTPEQDQSESPYGEKLAVGRIGVTQFFPVPELVQIKSSLTAALGIETGDRVVSVSGPERSKEIKYLHEFFAELDFFWEVSGPTELAKKIVSEKWGITASQGSEGAVRLPRIFVWRNGQKVVLEGSEEKLAAWAERYLMQLNSDSESGFSYGSGSGSKFVRPMDSWSSLFLTSDLLVASLAGERTKGAKNLSSESAGKSPDAEEATAVARLSECGISEGTAIRGARSVKLVSSKDSAGGKQALTGAKDEDHAARLIESQSPRLFSSPVDLSIFLSQFSDLEPDAYSSAQVVLQVVNHEGNVTDAACSLALKTKRDHLNRNRSEIIFPVVFKTSGLPMEQVVLKSEGISGAIVAGSKALGEQASTIFVGLKKLVSGSIPLANLGGPIQIARVAGNAAEGGFLLFFLTVSWMSVNIGMFNLLPLPALDGGALMMQTVEAAYGRPLPEALQASVQKLGVVMILCLIVLVFYNDILRLLGG